MQAADTAEPQSARRGDLVAVGLIGALLGFLFLFAFVVFSFLAPEDRSTILAPVVRLTHSAFSAVCILAALDAKRLGHPTWWRYLLVAVIPIIQLVATWKWFRIRKDVEAEFLSNRQVGADE